MEHAYPDELAYRDSPIHRLDPRTKITAALLILLTGVLLPARATWQFAACLLPIFCAALVAGLPARSLIARAAAFLPFVLTAVVFVPFTRRGDGAVAFSLPAFGASVSIYREGLLEAKAILLKSLISALSMIILISTTRFTLIIAALARMGFPRTLLVIISFLYRYLFLLVGEFKRLTRAARSRNWHAGTFGRRMGAAGGIVGSLFLRSYARAERVHIAMLSRGYSGAAPAVELPAMRTRDFALPIACAAAGAALIILV
jgi:cobalt/nickel transport system permease protein